MSPELTKDLFGGAVIGLFALAMDYFVFQHFVRTPVNMMGGVGVGVVAAYLIIPFLILRFGVKKNG